MATPTPDDQLSANYFLKDFLVTNQSLSAPNFPDQSSYFDNIAYLAAVCEDLLANVGPFDILSAFRTHELHVKLGEAGNPTAKNLSFHEIGRSVDIYPTSMSIDEFFGLILSDERLKNLFAEIAIKPAQNTIHLSINVPGDTRTPKITGLTADQNYARLPADVVQGYIDQASAFLAANQDYVNEVIDEGTEVVKSKVPLLAAVVAGLGALYFTMGRK